MAVQEKIDYVHGEEVVCQLGAQPGNAGFYVPGMHKSDLFKTGHPGRGITAQNVFDG